MRGKRILASALAMLLCVGSVNVTGFASSVDSTQDAGIATVSAAENVITVTPDAAQCTYKIVVSGVSSSYTNVFVPVWSRNGGQDDIIWYSAQKTGNGQWECTVDMRKHKCDTGIYDLHVYGSNGSGEHFLNSAEFNVADIYRGTVTCTSDEAAGTYRLTIGGISSPAGISSVMVPVWSDVNGQDDVVWYEAKASNGQWYVDVNVKNHGYSSGSYTAHVYAKDGRGVESLCADLRFNVARMASNKVKTSLNADQSKVTITLENANVPAGTEYVLFPVWGDENGQNDIVWYQANKIDNYTYQVTVPVINHKEAGGYQVHAYAASAASTTFVGNTTFKVDSASGNVSVASYDQAGGFFTVEISGVKAPATVTSMKVPVWSEVNGQDDIVWYEAQRSGDKWVLTVDIGNHGINTGKYQIHVYAQDSRSIMSFIGHTSVDVKKPNMQPKLTATVNPDYATVSVTLTNVIGASGVKLPVWGDANGQNDVTWYDMTKVNSRTWTATVHLGNHMEMGGYQVHAYAESGKNLSFLTNTTFNISKIVVDDVSVINKNDESGAFTVAIQNVSAIPDVDYVRIAVWSDANGQDDLQWYAARREGSRWIAIADPANHSFDRGVYHIHAYAYNPAGQIACIGGTTHNVIINGKVGFVKEGSAVYYYERLNQKAHGMKRINGANYYFDPATGAMATGWKYADGYKYYFGSDGRMVEDLTDIVGMNSSYYTMINKQQNTVTLYAYDAATGSYCIPVKSMLCSTGDPTPLGTFNLGQTYRWLLMYNGTYCQFLSLITGDMLIHSITYERYGDPYTLQTIGYNRLGVNKSAGCVRLQCGNAYLIYNLVNAGRLRQVTIYNSENPGPYGRPYVAPIPDNQRWDPTDPTI